MKKKIEIDKIKTVKRISRTEIGHIKSTKVFKSKNKYSRKVKHKESS